MALTWTIICDKRDDTGSVTMQQPRDGQSANWQYNVQLEATDPADPDFNGSKVTAIEAASAPVLPDVGVSIYDVNDIIIPWLICSNKTARRDTRKATLFNVSITYSGNGKVAQDVPPSISLIAPDVEYLVQESQRVVYKDNNNKACLTPTKNYYDQEFIKQLGAKVIQLKQYEASLSHNEMADRLFSVNGDTFQGDAAWTWLITELKARDVQVKLLAGWAPAVVAEYTIVSNPHPEGWRAIRSLIDSHYLEQANDLDTKTPYYSKELRTYVPAIINLDGTLKDPQDFPLDDKWEILNEKTYGSFLQIP